MLVVHKPVLTEELLNYLKPNKRAGIFLDCTGGDGGHSERVIQHLTRESKLIILDMDVDAVKRLQLKFSNCDNVHIIKANFRNVDNVLNELGITRLDGLYADLGMSSFQLKDSKRGFSFLLEGPLDMRMDKSLKLTAYEIINSFSIDSLTNIIKQFGEEKFAKRISYFIMQKRAIKKINTTLELANIIKEAIPVRFQRDLKIHPATKTFQALRIYVNNELEALEELLKKLENIINPGGKVVFISFHSLEDRLIKEKFEYFEKECICPPRIPVCVCNKKRTFKILTKKPVIATFDERQSNPLSRSAKLRAAERVI
jgi:16S rRNA (cytosine1402-N4)-methyltransferase